MTSRSKILVICDCEGEHRKGIELSTHTTLTALKDAVKGMSFNCLPENFLLKKKTGDDQLEALKDGPLHLVALSQIKVVSVGLSSFTHRVLGVEPVCTCR